MAQGEGHHPCTTPAAGVVPARNRTRSVLAVLLVAAALRFWYATDLPLNGDEVGVGVLQATGQAVTYADHLSGRITPLDTVRDFVDYDPAYSARDVLQSLREAGMHPPAYYVALHYVIRAFGNEARTLRTLSIIMSLGAILVCYWLGRTLAGETAGLWSAALLAVAPYGVVYGSLVRPYPAAMLLALTSTLLAIGFARWDGRRSSAYWLWLLVSTVGLYTVYQYSFVFAGQVLALALAHRRQPHRLAALGAGTAIVVTVYLPWIPALETHVLDITTHRYYFHQPLDAWRLVTNFVTLNVPALWPTQFVLTVLIGLAFYLALAIGLAMLSRSGASRLLGTALGAYVGIYATAESWLTMSTLAEPKFLFFLAPMFLLLVTIGLLQLRRRTNGRPLAVWCAFGILLVNSVAVCAYRGRFADDAEAAFVADFRPVLNDTRRDELLVLNTMQRRYLFPLVHGLSGRAGIGFVQRADGRVVIPDEEALQAYNRVVVINLYVDYEVEALLSGGELRAVADTLAARGFSPVQSLTSGGGDKPHSLVVFEKN